MRSTPLMKYRAILPTLLGLALSAGCSNPLSSDLGDGRLAEGEAREFVGALAESLGPAEDRAREKTYNFACAEGGATDLVRVGTQTIDRDGEETFEWCTAAVLPQDTRSGAGHLRATPLFA